MGDNSIIAGVRSQILAIEMINQSKRQTHTLILHYNKALDLSLLNISIK